MDDPISNNRESERQRAAQQEILRQQQAGNADTGLVTIVGPDPDYGGYIARDSRGGLIRGVRSDTNRGFATGDQASYYPGTRIARLDSKPAFSGGGAGGAGTDGAPTTPTGITTGILLPPLYPGSPGSNPTKWRPDPNNPGECTPVAYAGDVKPGDFATPEDCVGDQDPGDKSWYCEVENGRAVCRKTTPGLGKWGSRDQCEEKIKPPTFSGGQCGIEYQIDIQCDVLAYNNSTGQYDTPSTAAVTYRAVGPIKNANVLPSPGDLSSLSACAGYTGGIIIGNAGPTFYRVQGASVVSVSPIGAGVDNCGDPPEQCGV